MNHVLIFRRPDPKDIFTKSLTSFREKVNTLCYTSTASFFSGLCAAFEEAINTEPTPPPVEVSKISPVKKGTTDIKQRRRLAKARVKTVEALLNRAVQDEREISGNSSEDAKTELKRLLDGRFEPQQESAAAAPEAESNVEVEDEAAVPDTEKEVNEVEEHVEPSETLPENEVPTVEPESIDNDMEDAPCEVDTEIVEATSSEVQNGESISTVALTEGSGIVSPPKEADSVKDEIKTNGHAEPAEATEAGPPTPPISNTDSEQGSRILTDGGIHPAILKDFRIDGATVSPIDELSDDSSGLSELGDDIEMLDADELAPGPVVPAPKKKSKNKRKRNW